MTELQNYKAVVREFLGAELLFSEEAFPHSDDASLLDEGIVDSMGVLELVAFIQSSFSISVKSEDVIRDNFDSVNKIAAYVYRKRIEQMGWTDARTTVS